MRAATFFLLLMLTVLWMLWAAGRALAKPYGPPSWATLNGPGLPQDIHLPIDKAATFGTFAETCISGPRQSTPPIQDWTRWHTYEATVFYATPIEAFHPDPPRIESGRQAFVTKQTLYVGDSLEGFVRIHSEMTILDQAGVANGWGNCSEKWIPLTLSQRSVLMEQVDRYSNIGQLMVFGCRWSAQFGENPYRSLATQTCQ